MQAANKASLKQRQLKFLRTFIDNLCKVFVQDVCHQIDPLTQKFFKDAEYLLKHADLKYETDYVSEAFAKALKGAHKKVQKDKYIIKVKHGKATVICYQYDVQELDRLTPSAFKRDAFTGKSVRKHQTLSGGWWRIFEFGSKQSKFYGFIRGMEKRGGWMSRRKKKKHPGIPRIHMLRRAWENEKESLMKLQSMKITKKHIDTAWRMTINQEGEFPCC